MDNKYASCTLTDLAQLAGVDLRTLQDHIEKHHLLVMIELGWRPWNRKLMPPVVKYLRNELIDKTNFTDDPN
ncbi:hypothetical protein [Fibrella forsythiae]|uniref:DNA-binding protein n=1 Tax=Fibrella forsythiae TaxID=2817061 RepID=A0ABS3JME6_9BACT|nr:hypothetical protein [Fibrella forsythiae]MBO0951188.1 hypothetical protein [Fibrella forsythiae]